jgi:hypothetical protein
MTMCGLSSNKMTKGGDYEEDDGLTSLQWGKEREKKSELKILSHLERVHG